MIDAAAPLEEVVSKAAELAAAQAPRGEKRENYQETKRLLYEAVRSTLAAHSPTRSRGHSPSQADREAGRHAASVVQSVSLLSVYQLVCLSV